jgi:hypothetical protein
MDSFSSRTSPRGNGALRLKQVSEASSCSFPHLISAAFGPGSFRKPGTAFPNVIGKAFFNKNPLAIGIVALIAKVTVDRRSNAKPGRLCKFSREMTKHPLN